MGQFLKRLCNDGFLMGNLNGGIDLMENWLSSLSAVGGRAELIEPNKSNPGEFP